MAGLCGFQRDIGGSRIADLAHHQDVRILAQKGTQHAGIAEPGFLVQVHLVDALQADFAGVFHAGDIDLGAVQLLQAAVERDSLAGAGRAGDQQHALWSPDGIAQLLQLQRLQPERFQLYPAVIGGQQADHDFFAKQRGQGADAQVAGLAWLQFQPEMAILRQTFFGDIEPGQHLDAAGDALLEAGGWCGDRLQLAVDAQAYPVAVLIGFKMQVGGTACLGRHQQCLQPGHGTAVIGRGQGGIGKRLKHGRMILVFKYYYVMNVLPVAGHEA